MMSEIHELLESGEIEGFAPKVSDLSKEEVLEVQNAFRDGVMFLAERLNVSPLGMVFAVPGEVGHGISVVLMVQRMAQVEGLLEEFTKRVEELRKEGWKGYE